MAGYKKFIAGDEALAADVNGYLLDQTVARFASAAARTAALPSPAVNQLTMLDTAPGAIQFWNGSLWADVKGITAAAAVLAGEATASSTYVDLTTPGPAASIVTGTTALVTVSSRFLPGSVGFIGLMSFAVSGASTIAAGDVNSLFMPGFSNTNSADLCRQLVATGLTPGLNTFTAKYRASGGSCTFTNRVLSVQAL